MFQFEIDDPLTVDAIPGGDNSVQKGDLGTGFKIGDRIRSETHFGTIKYIGSVGTYPGIWLGIQWDDPTRGRHSGIVDDVQYFQSTIANAASFIRTTKAQKIKDILEALYERYGEDETNLSSMKSIEDRLETRKISFTKLTVLNLSGKAVNDLTAWKAFCELCPNIEVMELSDNLISDWNSTGNICKALTKLTRVDFSRNPLPEPSLDEIDEHRHSFPNLQHIILGGMHYNWDGILRVTEMFPNIVNITIPLNDISRIVSPSNTLQNLKSIDLEKNKITQWEEVLKLSVLEKLEHINLCGNLITRITLPEDDIDKNKTYFHSLTKLNISENLIEDWASISQFNKLGNLKELRIDLNPFLNLHKRTTNRQIIIARLDKLQKLEGVEIHRQERRDAELDYVKLYSNEWNNKLQRSKFLYEHPSYEHLATKYGFTETDGNKSTVPSHSMQASLINLIIVPESSISYKECEKKILKTMTVQKLKGLLQRMFRIPSVPIHITVISCQNPAISFVLENDFFEIGQYSIEDGDTLRLRW